VSVHPPPTNSCLYVWSQPLPLKGSSRDNLFNMLRRGSLKEMDHRSSYLVWDDAT
jgi:hypothetical protein